MWRRLSKQSKNVKSSGGQDKSELHRRDLLQGRLWKLVRPSAPDRPFKPLVMRYPRERHDVEDQSPGNNSQSHDSDSGESFQQSPNASSAPRTIAGIAIDPVPATDFVAPDRSQAIPVFRPPGAVQEEQFLAGCTRCDDCANACPHDAITKLSPQHGRAEGTPTINADAAACHMCEDMPCIDACKPGVLSASIPVAMGTAKVTEHLCLAHHSTTCTVCSERCPVEDVIQVEHGKPIINEEACTGCGVCRYVCPAPENAILLMPTFVRPRANP